MQLKRMWSGTVYLYLTGLSDGNHLLTGVERIEDVTNAVLLQ
jgi:hypothetical protein